MTLSSSIKQGLFVQAKGNFESNFGHEKFWEIQNTSLASVLLVIGLMDVFICLNLSMHPKYSRGLIRRMQSF